MLDVKRPVRACIRVACSLLVAVVFYTGWMAVFIVVGKTAGASFKAALWLSGPVVTAAGFAFGMTIGECLTSVKRPPLLQTCLWPLVGCGVGAGAVFSFGPMLIVFGMFFLGTASVVLREALRGSARSSPQL
jgi:hypothetical protein